MPKSPYRPASRRRPTDKPETPGTTAPLPPEGAAPPTEETAAPASRKGTAPPTEETAAPASRKRATPPTEETAAPASRKGATPPTEETAAPASRKGAAPPAEETAAVAGESDGPATRPRGRRARREVQLEGLKQLAMIWFYVADLKASVEFYRDRVGLKLSFLDEQAGWAFFATGAEGVDLGLCVWSHGGRVPRGGGACPLFEVVDLSTARTALEERGVVFDGEIVGNEGERRHTTFHDPDGNPLQLTQNW
jgi:CreA protein